MLHVCFLGGFAFCWRTFLSSSVHRRHADIYGDQGSVEVKNSNCVAHLVAGLMRLAWARKVRIIVEQPADSVLFQFPAIKKALRIMGATSVRTYLGVWGMPVHKAIVLQGNARFLPALRRDRPRGPAQRGHQVYSLDCAGRVSGGRGLAATAHYPLEFGRAVAAAYRRSMEAQQGDAESEVLRPVVDMPGEEPDTEAVRHIFVRA